MEEDKVAFEQFFADFTASVNNISANQIVAGQRLCTIEDRLSAGNGNSGAQGELFNHVVVDHPAPSSPRPGGVDSDSLQQAFRSISDSVKNLCLSTDLGLHDSSKKHKKRG